MDYVIDTEACRNGDHNRRACNNGAMAIDDLERATQPSQAHDHRITWYLCIVAAVAVLICAFHGLGMDEDSTAYLAAAVNLAHGRGLTGIGGTPYTLFGPALPSFVYLGVRLGTSAQAAALILNMLSAVLTVILGRILLKRHLSDSRFVLAGSVFVAIGWPLLQVTSLAIPEPLTIVVLLLLVLLLEDFNETSHPVASVGAIAFLLNLAFFLRYASVAFIVASVFIVFISRKRVDGVLRRVLTALALTLLSLLGPCLWMLRNHSVDGSLLGPRYPPLFSAATVAYQYVLAIGKFLLPGPDAFEVLVFTVVALSTVVALRLVYNTIPGGLREFLRRLGPWAVLLYVCISYVIYLYAAELSTKIDPIDSRLLVPIYVPCVVLVVGLVESVFSRLVPSKRSTLLATRALQLFIGVQVLISLVLVGDFAVNGREYTSTAWRTSSLVTAARSLTGIAAIYTNNAPGLWARLGSDNIHALPTSLDQARASLACPGARVVYFTQNARTYFNDTSKVTGESQGQPQGIDCQTRYDVTLHERSGSNPAASK